MPAWLLPAAAIAGTAVSAIGQERANRQNLKIAREQMAFQERMSSTAMQRRVADLRKAGLNPMLAGMNQVGASSPPGQTAKMENVGQNVAATAMDFARTMKELKLLDAQIAKTHNEGMVAGQDVTLKSLLANALGFAPKNDSMNTVQHRLIQAQLASANNMVRLQRSGALGKFGGLDFAESYTNLMGWIAKMIEFTQTRSMSNLRLR